MASFSICSINKIRHGYSLLKLMEHLDRELNRQSATHTAGPSTAKAEVGANQNQPSPQDSRLHHRAGCQRI